MAETLKIENFGPIKKANLKLGKTTIFIGEQSSGKSTIAKLIAILTDKWLIGSVRYSYDATVDGFFRLLRNYNIDDFFNKNCHIQFKSSHYQIEFKNGYLNFDVTHPDWIKKDIIELLQKYSNNPTKDNFIQLAEYITSKNSDFAFDFDTPLWAYRTQHAIDILFKDILSEVTYNLYIPAERILVSTISNNIASFASKNIPLPQFFLTFLASYEEARSANSSYEIQPLNITYKRKGDSDYIEDLGQTFHLSQASSGIQSLVPLYLTVSRSSEFATTLTRFVIEEPELSLYPSTQLKLVNTLSEKCTKEGNQLVITTHSPYVLTALNNLLFAYKTAAKKPNQKKAINKIIPEASWLNPDEFAAYYVGKGTVKNIVDKETGLINGDRLDNASYEIGDAFDALMEIYKD